MKHAILGLWVICCGPIALASPELAEDWGVKASGLYGETVQLLETSASNSALDTRLVTEIERFSVTATRLGTWNDEAGGSADFGCIFRGMAEEAETQLFALETAMDPGAREAALKRLIVMFDDAQSIAAAAALSARGDAPGGPQTGLPHACPANPQMGRHLLGH